MEYDVESFRVMKRRIDSLGGFRNLSQVGLLELEIAVGLALCAVRSLQRSPDNIALEGFFEDTRSKVYGEKHRRGDMYGERNKMITNQDNYPVFCGRVIGVPAIIEDANGQSFTYIDFVPVKKDLSEEQYKKLMVNSLRGQEGMGNKLSLQERVERVVIPLRLDPHILTGGEIRGSYARLEAVQKDVNGISTKTFVRTYEIEIIKGALHGRGDVVDFLEHRPHTGLRYVKILGDCEEEKE